MSVVVNSTIKIDLSQRLQEIPDEFYLDRRSRFSFLGGMPRWPVGRSAYLGHHSTSCDLGFVAPALQYCLRVL